MLLTKPLTSRAGGATEQQQQQQHACAGLRKSGGRCGGGQGQAAVGGGPFVRGCAQRIPGVLLPGLGDDLQAAAGACDKPASGGAATERVGRADTVSVFVLLYQ